MGSRCTLVFVMLFTPNVFCYGGDPVMYLPPFEVRTVKDPQPPFMGNQQFQSRNPGISQVQSQRIIHTAPQPKAVSSPTRLEKDKLDSKNFTFSDLLEAFNNLEEKDENLETPRSASYESPYGYEQPGSGYQQPSSGYQQPSSGYQQPNSGYQQPVYGYQPQPPNYTPYGYNEPAYIPPKAAHHTSSKISLLKPDLSDLVKPVSTKVASKVSGLIGLGIGLLTGTAPNDLELKGFKDIVINGIVKPLLLAKGGLKSLINKLTIPVIALLLINLEVLVTVWWLWDDCPEPTRRPPPYHPRPLYGYNSYQ